MAGSARRWTVAAGATLMLLGTLFGFGLIGTPVESSIGGSLAATATLIAPATPAFSIWSVIYLGLFAYTVWQFFPTAHTPRIAGIAPLAAASMALNGAWLLVVQAGWIWASVAVIAALVVVLGLLLRRLSAEAPANTVETLLVDGTFGLYLGWSSVATLANVTAALVAAGLPAAGPMPELWAVVVLAVGAALGALLALFLGGRVAIAAAMAWGLSWIAVGRLLVAPESVVVGVAAVLAAVIVAGAAVAVRVHRGALQPAVARAGGRR